MTFVKHAACDTDVVFKPVRLAGELTPTIRVWCPTCLKIVERSELSGKGPFSAYLAQGFSEEA